jgi:predicted acylesterase/phospholipase RssA
MKIQANRMIRVAAALSLAFALAASVAPPLPAQAQGVNRPIVKHPHARPKAPDPTIAAAPPKPAPLPPRTPFTAAEDATAKIPGMPDARFWADSVDDFKKTLPSKPGPWLILSSGGEDGAFGAGFLNGLTASGKRPDYTVVTGVSTGALIAPFAFAGPHYDDALRDAFTKITSADIFEIGATPESFVDTWPLKDLIAKEITPALLADIAAQYRAGRRLFIVTTDLDSERSVVWNMGAIAARGSNKAGGDKAGGEQAAALFRSVLLASSSIPGAFPPVLIDVESNGKRFAEMHVDGGVGGQFFLAPAALLAATSDYRLPATDISVVVNTGLQPDFEVVPRTTPAILAQSVGMAVKGDTRLMLDRAYLAAKRSGVNFKVASIPPSFNAPSRGTFDPDYMKKLFQTGYDLGHSPSPFSSVPPAYPEAPASQPQDPDKTGAN